MCCYHQDYFVFVFIVVCNFTCLPCVCNPPIQSLLSSCCCIPWADTNHHIYQLYINIHTRYSNLSWKPFFFKHFDLSLLKISSYHKTKTKTTTTIYYCILIQTHPNTTLVRLRHALMTWGEKFTAKECDVILQEAPVDSKGRIDIKRFATLVTRGAEEEDQDQA